MKKFLLFLALFVLSTTFLVPQFAEAALVPCGNEGQPPCELKHIVVLIANVFEFIVLQIATPLAGLMILIAGVLWIVSGLSENLKLASIAKTMLKVSIIAILLIWGSVLIIDTVLKAIGYDNVWNINPFN